MQAWFGRRGEGKSNLRQCGTKKWFPLLFENCYSDPVYEFGDRTVKARKLKPADGFRHSLLEWSFPRNKVKLNESRLLKFYQVKQLKENSTENSAEKNWKDSQFNELWNISIKPKSNEKYSDSKNFIYWCRDRPTNPCRDLPINLKHIKLHARVRTIISEYDRNWLSPFFLLTTLTSSYS